MIWPFKKRAARVSEVVKPPPLFIAVDGLTEIAITETPPSPTARITRITPLSADGFPPEFTLAELTRSQIAARKGLNNNPPREVLANLRQTAKHMLRVRAALKHPVIVSSGYRGPEVNRAVGGAKASAHMTGWAVDFTCPGFGSPYEVARAISMLDLMSDVDQLIHEYGAWVHISFDPRKRGEVFSVLRNKSGGVHHIKGIVRA